MKREHIFLEFDDEYENFRLAQKRGGWALFRMLRSVNIHDDKQLKTALVTSFNWLRMMGCTAQLLSYECEFSSHSIYRWVRAGNNLLPDTRHRQLIVNLFKEQIHIYLEKV